MITINKQKAILIILITVSIIVGIFLRLYIFNNIFNQYASLSIRKLFLILSLRQYLRDYNNFF